METQRLRLALIWYWGLYAVFALLAWLFPEGEAFAPIFVSAWGGAIIGTLLVWVFGNGRADDYAIRSLLVSGVIIDLLFHRLALGIASIKVLSAALHAVGNLGMLMAAIGLGLWVGRGLQKPNYLVMAALVGALTDVFSVYAGPTKHLLGTGAFPYVSFHWGILGQGGVMPIVGAGDFVFLALYFFGARKFGLDDRKTLLAMIAALGLGFWTGWWFQVAIPALPFMSAALLSVHGRELLAKIPER
jgi:hypothetical protein